LGKSVPEIIALYQDHVPTVMKNKDADGRSGALAELSTTIFGDAMFTDVKTSVGIVTTKWVLEKPMIFKTHVGQAHGMKGSFVPGFGVKIGDAVQASCSAYPYFNRKTVLTSSGDSVELIDGGFCANNPTLYAIADATVALGVAPENIRVVSLGCGNYPPPPVNWWTVDYWKQKTPGVQLLQKTLEINTQSMDQLRVLLYKPIQTVRINQSFSEPAMATDLFEHDLKKLNVLTQRGVQSFAEHEPTLQAFLVV
jgi:patatin-like phospholipase/acyl hydrolase